jgi:hypothetical protein
MRVLRCRVDLPSIRNEHVESSARISSHCGFTTIGNIGQVDLGRARDRVVNEDCWIGFGSVDYCCFAVSIRRACHTLFGEVSRQLKRCGYGEFK